MDASASSPPHDARGVANLRTSHSFIVPSVDRLASCRPSRCHRMHETSEPTACAPRATSRALTSAYLYSCRGVAASISCTGLYSGTRSSHSCSEPSCPPTMIVLPSACHAHDVTAVLMPLESRGTATSRWPELTLRDVESSPRSRQTSTSHKRTVPSSLAVATVFWSVGCQRAAVQPATWPRVWRMSRMYMSPFIIVPSLRPSRSKRHGCGDDPATITRCAVGL
mmetsp:Transcript_41813/g.115296  ORF Transcript_41813/g.115296 Transcript_41813/m.115296 type:complete len:224 (-) Transcript_41813:451-1122(-)